MTAPPPTGSFRASAAISSSRSMRWRISKCLSRGRTQLLLFLEFCFESIHDMARHKLTDIVAESGHLANAMTADVTMLETGHQVNRFDLRGHLLVHERHVKLRFEVCYGTDATHEGRGLFTASKVD